MVKWVSRRSSAPESASQTSSVLLKSRTVKLALAGWNFFGLRREIEKFQRREAILSLTCARPRWTCGRSRGPENRRSAAGARQVCATSSRRANPAFHFSHFPGLLHSAHHRPPKRFRITETRFSGRSLCLVELDFKCEFHSTSLRSFRVGADRHNSPLQKIQKSKLPFILERYSTRCIMLWSSRMEPSRYPC